LTRTQIDIDIPTHEPPRRRNWAAIDIKVLQELLSQLIVPRLVNALKSHIKLATVAFTAAIRKAVDQSVLWARLSAWSNPDFTRKCKEAVQTCRQLRCQLSNTHNPWIWRAYLQARNKKKCLQAIEQGPLGLWKLAKWAHSRNGVYKSGITSTLQDLDSHMAETVEAKTQLLREAFFPPISVTIEFPEILCHKIEHVICSIPPDKVLGEDGIPNSFWHKIIGILVIIDTLYEIFNACHLITIVLCKDGNRDYHIPKAYRPVALLNTLGKFLKAIIARHISYAMESEGLLPSSHLDGRKGISMDHAIQIILDRIRGA
ncbi:hypothetical protein TSTA_052410, partial [Talaromyces stipitatus ATCC 10500]